VIGDLAQVPLIAQAAEVDTGDTAWMLAATALVLLMTIGLGVFYAGLVRAKNALNTFMMCVASIAIGGVVWALVGYSLAFDGTGDLIGGLNYAGLHDVGFEPFGETTIPHLVFFAFQGTFAIITLALVSGAVVERMRFSAFIVFGVLWSVGVYAVLAHWGFGGGWLFEGGTLDFAGGIAVEMASGFSALAAALVVGARKDYGRQALLPHNSVLVLLGAGILWFGWFGFNGGSGFGTGDASVLAFTNTLLCPAATLATWMVIDAVRGRKVTAVGAATAIITGCVLITPAGGFISPAWAMALGAFGAVPCYYVIVYRTRTRVDETLDVLAVHGIAGFIGILTIGFIAQAAWNGVSDGWLYGNFDQFVDQALAAVATPLYAFGATFVLLKLIGAVMPLRGPEDDEAVGMDAIYHGEEAYPTGEGAILVSPEAGEEEPVPVAQP
jgi:Amt family ammonium transporter